MEKYFTLVARDVSARKALTMVSSFRGTPPSELQFGADSMHSTRSHIHGSNRKRIALHVMLSGSRNRTRCS